MDNHDLKPKNAWGTTEQRQAEKQVTLTELAALSISG
jgi:hypothetical protein